MKRRRFLELASTAPLVYLAAENVLHRDQFVLDTDRAILGEALPGIDSFITSSQNYSSALDNLASAYYSAYEKTRIVVEPCLDSNGDPSTCTKTESYWDEDRGITSHNKIFSWRRYHNNLASKAASLTKRNLVDATQLDKVEITQEGLPTGLAIGVSLTYAAEIAGLLGYEEATGLKDYDSERQTSRRSLFKMAASGLGALVAYTLRDNEDESRLQKENKLAEMRTIQVLNDETVFERYFDIPIEHLSDAVTANIDNLRRTFDNVRNSRVKAAYQKVTEAGSNFVKELDKGVSEELGIATRCGLLTDKIDNENNDLSPLLETLAVGGIMAAVIIPVEIINQRKR